MATTFLYNNASIGYTGAEFFFYNGIFLDMYRTNVIRREVVLSEDRTTYLYTRWLIDITCLYNPGATAYSLGNSSNAPVVNSISFLKGLGLPAFGASLAPTTDAALRHVLMQPRGQLVWVKDNPAKPFLLSPAIGYTTDPCNGPKPLACEVTQIAGQKLFIVAYRIEVCTQECPGTAPPPALLSNRWSERHIIDFQGYTTRVTEGRAVFRVDQLIKLKKAADEYRAAIVPLLPTRFRRDSVNIMATPDGGQLLYQVVDQQVDLALGHDAPAVRFEGQSTVAVGIDKDGGNPISAKHVVVKAYGKADTHRFDLVQWAIKVALGALDITGIDGERAGIIRQAAITKSLDQKYAEIDLTATITQSTKSILATGDVKVVAKEGGFLGLSFDHLKENDIPGVVNDDEDTNPNLKYDSGTRGPWNALIVRQTLETACKGGNQPPDISKFTGKDDSDTSYMTGKPTEVKVVIVDDLPTDDTIYTKEATDTVLTRYTLKTTVKHKQNVLALPVGSDDLEAETVFVRYAAPQSKTTVRWHAEAVGKWPQLPHPETGDDNDVFMGGNLTGKGVQAMPDGHSLLHTLKGYYVFHQRKPKGLDDDLFLGANPYLTTKTEDVTLPKEAFVDKVLGDGKATNILSTGAPPPTVKK